MPLATKLALEQSGFATFLAYFALRTMASPNFAQAVSGSLGVQPMPNELIHVVHPKGSTRPASMALSSPSD